MPPIGQGATKRTSGSSQAEKDNATYHARNPSSVTLPPHHVPIWYTNPSTIFRVHSVLAEVTKRGKALLLVAWQDQEGALIIGEDADQSYPALASVFNTHEPLDHVPGIAHLIVEFRAAKALYIEAAERREANKAQAKRDLVAEKRGLQGGKHNGAGTRSRPASSPSSSHLASPDSEDATAVGEDAVATAAAGAVIEGDVDEDDFLDDEDVAGYAHFPVPATSPRMAQHMLNSIRS
jgi:hypothetical protein